MGDITINNVPDVVKKEIRSDFAKFIRTKARDSRERRDKICRKYQKAIRDGKSEEDAITWLAECFDTAKGNIKNAIRRRYDVINPKAQAITDGLIAANMEQSYNDIQIAYEDCNAEIAIIDDLIVEGVKMYDVEETEVTQQGKMDIKTTKRIPILEARKRVQDRLLSLPERFLESIRKIAQSKNPLINLHVGVGVADLADGDLDAELEMLGLQKVETVEDGSVEN